MSERFLLIAALIFLSFSARSQDRVNTVRELEAFHAISITSGIDAELILSEKESVEIDLEGAQPAQMITEVQDGILSVRMKTGNYRDADLKVRIHFRQLTGMEVTARAAVWSYETLFLDRLDIRMNNGGALRLKLYCDSLKANISQGSILTLTGEGKIADIKAGTNATFNGYQFNCREVTVSASGTGKAKVSASGYLKADATTGGFVGYVGNPEKVERKTSLKGEIVETFLED